MTTALVVEAFLALPHGLPARLHHGRRDRGDQNFTSGKVVKTHNGDSTSFLHDKGVPRDTLGTSTSNGVCFLRLSIFGPHGHGAHGAGVREGRGEAPRTPLFPKLWSYPPSSSSMVTHWALLQPWLAVGGGNTPFSTCSPGALHVGTHAGSSVACHRFEGAT